MVLEPPGKPVLAWEREARLEYKLCENITGIAHSLVNHFLQTLWKYSWSPSQFCRPFCALHVVFGCACGAASTTFGDVGACLTKFCSQIQLGSIHSQDTHTKHTHNTTHTHTHNTTHTHTNTHTNTHTHTHAQTRKHTDAH